jgi:hypothetical protein
MHDLPIFAIFLMGAGGAAIHVIASAVADRIRGIRYTRERVAREPQPSRDRKDPKPWSSARPAAPPLLDRGLSQRELMEAQGFNATDPRARDIVAALMSVGYKKAAATEAVMGCSAADRATLELWTAAALRRAGKKVVAS